MVLVSVFPDAVAVELDPKLIFGILVTWIVAMALYIVKLHRDKDKKIEAVYEERIKEMKEQEELITTFLDAIEKENQKRRGGH